jgi:hypothetical protein
MSITRRKAVAILGSLAAFSMTPFKSIATIVGQPSKHKKPSIRLVRHDEADFFALVNEHFPGYTQHRYYDKLLPVSAIVINNGELPVSAFALKWTLVKDGSKKREMKRRYMRMAGRIPSHRIVTGQMPVLRPGEFALATPFFAYSAVEYQQRGGKLQPARLSQRQRRAGAFVKHAHSAEYVGVSVDALISRKVITKESSHNLAHHYAVYRNAERDEALALLKGYTEKSGQPGNRLLQLLQDDIDTGRASGSRGHKLIYWRARTHYAIKLRRLVNVKGEAKALELLGKVTKMKRTVLRHV